MELNIIAKLVNWFKGNHVTKAFIPYFLLTLFSRIILIESSMFLPIETSFLLLLAACLICFIFYIWLFVSWWKASQDFSNTSVILKSCLVIYLIYLLSLTVKNFIPSYPPANIGFRDFGNSELIGDIGPAIYIEGDIGRGTVYRFRKFTQANSSIRQVVITSAGGSLRESLQLADEVSRLNFNTHAYCYCESGCVNVLASGNLRTATDFAMIGVHQARNRNTNSPDSEGDKMQANSYRKRGISEAFIEKVNKTPNSSAWYPSNSELLRYGILTSIFPTSYSRRTPSTEFSMREKFKMCAAANNRLIKADELEAESGK